MKVVLMFNDKKEMYSTMRHKFTDNMENANKISDAKKYKKLLGIPETGRICVAFANINRENDKEFAHYYAALFCEEELYCMVVEYNNIDDISDNFMFSKHENILWSEDIKLDNATIMSSFKIDNSI